MRLAVAAIFVLAMSLLSLSHRVQSAPAIGRAAARQNAPHPRSASSATSFVAIAFPSPHPSAVGNVAFLPNGTAYFTDAKNELASFTPSGVYTRIPVPHAVISYTLLYAHGVFWMIADQGIVKVAPDGSHRRWYSFASPGTTTSVQSLVAGPDGGIYGLGQILTKSTETAQTVLFRFGTNGAVTSTPISVTPAAYAAEVFGPDNLLYFAYYTRAGTYGIARMERNGSLTLFPIAGSTKFSSLNSFVVSRGGIYFNYTYYDAAANYYCGELGRITPAGVITMTAFPAVGPDPAPSVLSVDKGGNLWVVIDNPYVGNQYFLYQFNVYTSHFNGPYLPGFPNDFYGGPIVAPDDDVWIVLPATSGADYFQPIGFGILGRGA